MGPERIPKPAWASAGNQFNGNIYVNTSGSATGVQFCGGNNTATATLAACMTVAAGSGGLTAGYLYLNQFTHAGSAPINVAATGTSSVYLGPGSNFGGTVTVTAPDIFPQGAIYNSAANFTKTGANNDCAAGGNTYQASATFTNAGSGQLALGNGTADTYNGPAIFNSTGSSYIGPAWNSTGNTFNGNIVVSSTGSFPGHLFL